MSHENIVATAVVVIEQTANFNAELLFKRKFTLCEVSQIHKNIGHERPDYINSYLGYNSNMNIDLKLIEEIFNKEQVKNIFENEFIWNNSQIIGLIPLGKVETKQNNLIVFPNSHIHKLDISNLTNNPSERLVIVFWLVNPDKRIISTKDVEPQQDKIKYKDALDNRLKLMEDRKYYKQSFNIRDLKLCEDSKYKLY